MISLFRRDSSPSGPVSPKEPEEQAASSAAEPDAAPDTASTPRKGAARQPGKGRPTPRRKDSQRRRPIEKPPANSKEARKRLREQAKAERSERYSGMRSGKEEFLYSRDRGPVRLLVRDIVDSRRNVGPWFFAGTFVVLVGSLGFMPPAVRAGVTIFWLFMVVAMLADAFVITRKIKRMVHDRHPEANERMMSLYFYGAMRSLIIRKWRSPKPHAEVGDEL